MEKLTLKTVLTFLGFWLVWFAPAVVAAYTLMNNTPEQKEHMMFVHFIIWSTCAVLSSLAVIFLVRPLEKKYDQLKTLTNEVLITTSKKVLDVYYIVSIYYAITWLVATVVLYVFLRMNFGFISANSIWVGGLAGFLAVPFMMFSVLPLMYSNVNRKLSAELTDRKLTVSGTYVSILKKNLLVAVFSILGITIWVGTFGFYTGINQMVEETKHSRFDKLNIIIQHVKLQGDSTFVSTEELAARTQKLSLPENELLLITDSSYNILLRDSALGVFQKNKKNVVELLGVVQTEQGMFYDNINNNVFAHAKVDAYHSFVLLTNVNENFSRLNSFWYWFVFFLIIGFGVVITSTVAQPIWMSKTINNLRQLFEKLAENDFSENATKDSEDELGTISTQYNTFVVQIRELIDSLQTTSVSVSSAGSQLSSISQQLALGANKQAGTTSGVAAAMEEMLQTINSNTEMAGNTNKIASQSAKKMKQTNGLIVKTLDAVAEISDKISIISELAEKTDMLSVNASIEAARAGVAGKGFAVVAGEIRKLADRSKSASVQINELSKNGQEISNIAGEKLEKVIPKITRSANLVHRIVQASREQQAGAELINTSLQQLTEITNSNSASAEEMSSSAEELSAQAEHLRSLIAVFKIKKQEELDKQPEVKTKPETNTKTEAEPNLPNNTNATGYNIDLSAEDKGDGSFENY